MSELTSPLSVREQNRLNIRGAILRAAMEQFATSGIGETTIDRIATEAGVARATVFKHFANKNAIIAAIVEQMDADLVQQVERHAQRDVPAAQRITDFFIENGDLLQSRREVIRPLVPILEQGWNELPGEARMQRLRTAFICLAAGPEGREDAETLAEVLLGSYLVITHHWRVQNHYSVSDHMRAAARLVCKAL